MVKVWIALGCGRRCAHWTRSRWLIHQATRSSLSCLRTKRKRPLLLPQQRLTNAEESYAHSVSTADLHCRWCFTL